MATIAACMRTILTCLGNKTTSCRYNHALPGEDVDREGLIKTPMRYAKALLYFSKGYTDPVNGTSKVIVWKLSVLRQILSRMPSSMKITTTW